MINLTEFIGQKLNNGQSLKGMTRKVQDKRLAFNKRSNNAQYQFEKKSIGLSTLLEIQNQQQNFGNLNVSQIGYNNSKLKQQASQYNKHSQIRNTRDELQQMRQKRKHLQQRLNKTLTKQQLNNTAIKYRNIQVYDINNNKSSQLKNLQDSNQSLQRSSAIINNKNLQNQSQQSIHEQSNNLTNSSYQKSSYSNSLSQSLSYSINNKSSLNQQSDRFLSYLKKDIYMLKCERFIHFIKCFKYKWIIKNINQYTQLNKILKREQHKLCKFVYISWKRHVNEQNKKLVMAQMIRKRIEQKRKQIQSQQKNSKQQKLQKQQQQKINKDKNNLVKQQPTKDLTPQKINETKQNINDISKISLRQISPIKPYKLQFQVPDHQISYNYDQYSCITERQQHNQEEEFIK